MASVRFVARVVSRDTVEVFREESGEREARVFLRFSCDPNIIENDPACWAAFTREPGGNRPAIDLLRDGWPYFDIWEGEAPELLVTEGSA